LIKPVSFTTPSVTYTNVNVPIIDIAIAPEAIVDTNGAGDAYVGRFIASLTVDKSTEDCTKAVRSLRRRLMTPGSWALPLAVRFLNLSCDRIAQG
jgi:hypothetical protein